MQIFFDNNGRVKTVDAEPTDTIYTIKIKIEDKEGIAVEHFVL